MVAVERRAMVMHASLMGAARELIMSLLDFIVVDDEVAVLLSVMAYG